MKNATYRVIHFLSVHRFVAVAWNYDEGVLLSSTDHATYTEARAELDRVCAGHNVNLRWFDGEYECAKGSELLMPC